MNKDVLQAIMLAGEIPKNMQTTDNLVTSISSSATHAQYPSAKAIYDAENWELINDVTFPESARVFAVNKDANGLPFEYSEIMGFISVWYVESISGGNNIGFNVNDIRVGTMYTTINSSSQAHCYAFHIWKGNTSEVEMIWAGPNWPMSSKAQTYGSSSLIIACDMGISRIFSFSIFHNNSNGLLSGGGTIKIWGKK